MSTTALRIELLIIGFQAIIWILVIFGFSDVVELYAKNVTLIKDTAAVLILIILATCYSIGAIVDSVTAAIEDPRSFSSPRNYDGQDSSVMRLKFPDAYKELVSSDFELRLLRSTSFNLLITAIAMFCNTELYVVASFILLAGFLVSFGWYRRKAKTQRRRKSLYEVAIKIA
jgi:hypothetical protein